jgi:hypothetical protein
MVCQHWVGVLYRSGSTILKSGEVLLLGLLWLIKVGLYYDKGSSMSAVEPSTSPLICCNVITISNAVPYHQ